MSNNKSMRIWQWAVGLLVLCNIGLIATIWLRPASGGPPPPGGGGPRNFVIRELKFTDDQVKKYDELIKAHQEAMTKLKQASADLRQKLFGNLKNEPQNDRVADSIAGQIAANQKDIEMVTYRHFVQVRSICTDDQKKVLDNIIGDVTKKMNGGPGGLHPPHDRPGPPPADDRPPHDGPPPPDDNAAPRDAPPPPPGR